jgi:hypothetical protein
MTCATSPAMEEVVESKYGLARIKQEGAPAHPEDILIHCGCEECEERWQRQLQAYTEFHGMEARVVYNELMNKDRE